MSPPALDSVERLSATLRRDSTELVLAAYVPDNHHVKARLRVDRQIFHSLLAPHFGMRLPMYGFSISGFFCTHFL